MMRTEVVIETVQFTPDREAVILHYRGRGVTAGPLAQTNLHHTTQEQLAARAPAEIRTTYLGYWCDNECKAELEAHLAESGIAAVVVPNVPTKASASLAMPGVAESGTGSQEAVAQ
jgi:hypothetical protein